MEKFVKNLFRKTQSVGALSVKTVRQKYLAYKNIDEDDFDDKDRKKLKSIVLKIWEQKNDGGESTSCEEGDISSDENGSDQSDSNDEFKEKSSPKNQKPRSQKKRKRSKISSDEESPVKSSRSKRKKAQMSSEYESQEEDSSIQKKKKVKSQLQGKIPPEKNESEDESNSEASDKSNQAGSDSDSGDSEKDNNKSSKHDSSADSHSEKDSDFHSNNSDSEFELSPHRKSVSRNKNLSVRSKKSQGKSSQKTASHKADKFNKKKRFDSSDEEESSSEDENLAATKRKLSREDLSGQSDSEDEHKITPPSKTKKRKANKIGESSSESESELEPEPDEKESRGKQGDSDTDGDEMKKMSVPKSKITRKPDSKISSKKSQISSDEESDSSSNGSLPVVKKKASQSHQQQVGSESSDMEIDGDKTRQKKESKVKKSRSKERKPQVEEKKKRGSQKKPESADSTKTEQVKNLEKIARICGALPIGKRYRELFEDCKSAKHRVDILKRLLREAGMEGRPSLEKAEIVKLQKEAAELDTANILDTGVRGRRTVRSVFSRQQREPSKSLQYTPVKEKFKHLKGIIDSDDSESD